MSAFAKAPWTFLLAFLVGGFGLLFIFTTAEAAPRTAPFVVGQTLDPGAESTEPCGPLDANCFPAVLSTANEGVRLSGNVLHLNFVGEGVTATHLGATTTITINGGTGLTALNGSGSSTQSFAVAATGTDFTISTVGGVHTFNVPSASASNRGLLTAADWSAFNAKMPSALTSGYILVGNGSNVATGTALSGDAVLNASGMLTIATSAVTSGKILDGAVGTADLANNSVDGTKLSLSGESLGDLMYYNGTNWVRLATSSEGQVLALSGGLPAWVASSTLSTISGVLGVARGGTGTTTAPATGQLLIGNGVGGYSFVATSSLGITPGIWGSVTGTLSSQTDLQTALNARLTLTDWFATTTDALDEGLTNFYFTNARADQRFATNLAGTTTSALAEGLNLYFTNARADARFSAGLAATTTTALAEGANLYFTTARGNANFADNLAATSTSALAEGANLYFTNARADNRFAINLAATTTSALAEGANLYWTNSRFDTRLAATTSLPGLTQLTGLTTVGTLGGTTTVAGNFTVNQGILIAAATPASTSRMLYNVGNTLFWNGSAVGSDIALSALSGATAVDVLDNANFAQTWNWSTATSGNALTLNASALTTGALLSLTTATGDTALSILGNIVPTSAPTETTSTSTTVTSIDSGNAGGHISATMGADGFPVIAYWAVTGGDLKVIKCGNAACSSGNTITTIDSTGIVGRFTDIVLGTDNFPVISYHDTTNGDLKVVKCGNAACSSGNTITTVDSSSTVVGTFTSLAIGTDGFPVISYYDETNTNLKVMKCGNAACSSGNSSTTADSTGDVGEYTSLAIGTDGFPVISYYDNTNDNLKVLKCGNSACTSGNSTTTLDTTDSVGLHTSLVIGADGFPVVAYYDITNLNLKFLKCGNTACTAGSTTTIQSSGDIGRFTSVAIGVDGLPVIAYEDALAEDPRVVKCANADCTSTNNFFQSLTDTDPTGDYNALLISTDGSPFVATDLGGFSAVRVTKFSSAFATGLNGLSLFTGGADIGNQANYFNNIYAAQLWGKRLTVANFDLAENYEAADLSLEAGDAVAINSDGKLVKAGSVDAVRTLGVISTAPGLLLSNWQDNGEAAMKPVALAGRVPVKLATDVVVVSGDRLAVSRTEAGRVRKAESGEASVGYVLKLLPDNQVEMFVQLSGEEAMMAVDFVVGTESAFSTSTLAALVATGGLTLEQRLGYVAATLDTLTSSTAAVITEGGERTFLGRVFDRFAQWLGDAGNGIAALFVGEVHTDKLCIGETCVTESQLQNLLGAQAVSAPVVSEFNTTTTAPGSMSDTEFETNATDTEAVLGEDDLGGEAVQVEGVEVSSVLEEETSAEAESVVVEAVANTVPVQEVTVTPDTAESGPVSSSTE